MRVEIGVSRVLARLPHIVAVRNVAKFRQLMRRDLFWRLTRNKEQDLPSAYKK